MTDSKRELLRKAVVEIMYEWACAIHDKARADSFNNVQRGSKESRLAIDAISKIAEDKLQVLANEEGNEHYASFIEEVAKDSMQIVHDHAMQSAMKYGNKSIH